jgi:hypothetical protein
MRINLAIVAALLSVSAPAMAQKSGGDIFRECYEPTLNNKRATYQQQQQAVAYCYEKASGQPYKDMPRTKPSYEDDPIWQQYQFDKWKAREDFNNDVESINRDYRLRRSGLLP